MSTTCSTFPSWVVEPMTSIEEAIKLGQYTNHYKFITNETVQLPTAKGKKQVFAVPLAKDENGPGVMERLKQCGLKLCVNAPSYLAGLMASVPESEMPAELNGTSFVAAEPNNTSSVIAGKFGDSYFLYVGRETGGKARRRLHLLSVDDKEWRGNLALLAEQDLAGHSAPRV